MHEALDVMLRTGQAPDSPVYAFVTKEKRRQLLRDAKRLRKQQVEPRYKNLHSADELADLYERTAQRDGIREQGQRDLQRISAEMKRIRREKDAEVEKAMETLLYESARSAIEQGPGSEADRRHRLLHYLWWFGGEVLAHRRKSTVPYSGLFPPTRDPSIQPRLELTAAQILDSPPPGEPVIAFPLEGSDRGRERIFLRIGVGNASWIGSFEIGHMSVGSVSMMPDDKHLFVSAKGAGYIIDAKSHTLVEQIGTHFRLRVDGCPQDVFPRRPQRHEPGVVRQERPPLENGHHQLRRVPRDIARRHHHRRRSAAGIPARVGWFFCETGDGRGSFRA